MLPLTDSTPCRLFLVAAFYVLPKIGSYLSTRPERVNQTAQTSFDKLRCLFAAAAEKAASIIGPRNWDLLVNGSLDNLWISMLFCSIMVKPGQLAGSSFEDLLSINLMGLFLAGPALAFVIRHGIAKYAWSPIAKWCAPRRSIPIG